MKPRDATRIERATADDAAEIAELYLASRTDALPFLRRVHSDAQTRCWIADTLLATRETWIARSGQSIVGVLALQGEDLDQLYLLPGWYRRGIGSLLLAKAKELSPTRLTLFTFQRNARARAFYEAHGFHIVEMGDGTGNEEGEPDILYEWRPNRS
ncbi:GNAT superfamily N-acetyltransferase [Bosea sp. BE125]|uniref:GNAT family N-acetyltransferase n=1 Tax=Bosea sp. BE125 TaxID=2817909 RepID=UPI002855A4FD|nr:GNAT family N-acetyltransferase [Bosea sp. BE125]MDR6873827.1 GNAT superfamily N-acetyltransferase [Bosea sp. BE125]